MAIWNKNDRDPSETMTHSSVRAFLLWASLPNVGETRIIGLVRQFGGHRLVHDIGTPSSSWGLALIPFA